MNDDAHITGTVFNIQRFTIHDGPGIRTEIFLKGCTLKCRWCSNPESLSPQPEIAVHPTQCIGVAVCGQCIEACPQNAIETRDDKVMGINRAVCDTCLQCASACPADALTIYGETMSVRQIVQAVLADRAYYKETGGVTFSGGEAFLQHRFVTQCLKACKKEEIHTCVESALNIPTKHLAKALPFIDMMIFDLKIMDDARHRQFTGRPNDRIKENARFLARAHIPMIVRIPVIPGHNDDPEDIAATGRFIREALGNGVRQVQLLRYRPLGMEKYDSLGMPYPMAGIAFPERAEAENRIFEMVQALVRMGLPAVAGTTTPVDGKP